MKFGLEEDDVILMAFCFQKQGQGYITIGQLFVKTEIVQV
jgi:hypothetical protein